LVVTHGDRAWQIAQPGMIFTLQAAVIFGSLGYFAGQKRSRRRRGRSMRVSQTS
jgi:hypothetical protein